MPILRMAAWAAAVALLGQQPQKSMDCKDHDDWTRWGDDNEYYCEIRVEHLPRPSGPVTIDGRPNGSIRVRGVEGDSVVLTERIETSANTDSEARALAAQIRVVTTGGTIHAEGPENRHRSHWVVSYRVELPAHTDLTLDTDNGGIRVAYVTGRMRLTTINGPIALDSVAGDVQARGENGPLDITLAGARWSGTGLDAETENGPVTLTVPKNYAAHLETGTVNGPMNIDLPITVQGHINLRRLSTDIGGGGPTIRAVTTNGPVSVERD
jgi:DUF4097 and DUF4098 domain-containing protein YvlB